jgi:hypothetical protein
LSPARQRRQHYNPGDEHACPFPAGRPDGPTIIWQTTSNPSSWGMSMETLRLEFVCTPEERKQAQDLHLTDQVGHGSKSRAGAVVLAMFGLMGLAAFVKLRALDPAVRPYLVFISGGLVAALVALAILRRKRESRKPADDLKSLLEVTAAEVRLAGPNGWAIAPWSAFGKAIESESLFVLPDATGYQLLVIPKRVFADEQSCTWFREQIQRAGSIAAPAAAETRWHAEDSPRPGDVRIEVHLRLSDYLDRALASWKVRGIMIFIGVLMLGAFVTALLNPPPQAVFTPAEVFFYFCLPFLMLIEVVIFLTIAWLGWWQQRRLLKPQVIALSDAGLEFSHSDGRGSAHWNDRVLHKETPWSFLIWWPESGVWFQLPKRAFKSTEGINRCRAILTTRTQRSTWYVG